MQDFTEYGHAIVSMAGFALLALGIGPFAAGRKAREGVISGSGPAPDYGNPTYRLWRAHLNATEIIGIFVAATVAAILAGAPPFWVNLAASVFLVARIAHLVIHVAGIGKPDGGVRSMIFGIGWLMCIGLAGLAIVAVFAN